MTRDSYQGIPKKVPVLVDKHGDASTATKNHVGYMVTGSGTLVDGYYEVVDTSVGVHTMVVTTAQSGTCVSGEAVDYMVVPATNTVMFSSFQGDGAFSYCLFNPGLGGNKI